MYSPHIISMKLEEAVSIFHEEIGCLYSRSQLITVNVIIRIMLTDSQSPGQLIQTPHQIVLILNIWS